MRSLLQGFIWGAIALVSGCSKAECDYLAQMAQNEAFRNELLQWSDQKIFSRDFRASDLGVGLLVGPGRHQAINLKRIGIEGSHLMPGSEVRVLFFEEDSRPGAVFIGRESYTGIVVAKDDIAQVYTNSSIKKGGMVEVNQRFAYMCSLSKR